MAAELWINDSGVARQIREVWVNDSGTARRVQEIWVNDAGTARKVFVSDVIALAVVSGSSTTSSPTNAVAQYILTSAGDITATNGSNTLVDVGDWIAPKINMVNFECRATLLSGTLTTGTTGAWLNLGTTRTWTRSTATTATTTFTLEIRRASDAVVMVSVTITLSATAGP